MNNPHRIHSRGGSHSEALPCAAVFPSRITNTQYLSTYVVSS